MSLFYDTSTFFERSGNAAAEFGEDLRDAVVTVACNIWAKYPDFVVNGRNPASSFARGYMNGMCSRIQPPVPFPSIPFQGGQCCDKPYYVYVTWRLLDCNGGNEISSGTNQRISVFGRIKGINIGAVPNSPSFAGVYLTIEDCQGRESYQPVNTSTRGYSGDGCLTSSRSPVASSIDGTISVAYIERIETSDGSPDDCGDIEPRYPINPPQAGDLTEIINITNIDGVDHTYEVTWNQYASNYNFPMSFLVGGTNVTLDVGGINFYGAPDAQNPGGNDRLPPPGSGESTNEEGNKYRAPKPENDYLVTPFFSQPFVVREIFETAVCAEGVLDTIADTIDLFPGLSGIFKVIFRMLVNILTELCEDNEDCTLAFPEVYPVLPGTQRPAIVYIYKELVDGERTRSSFSSTVPNPSSAAIAAINSVNPPDKFVGRYVASMRLTDGSRVSASGNTKEKALLNMNFYLSQVRVGLVPIQSEGNLTISERSGIKERLLNCSQIEYYPNGKASNVEPEIRRSIDPPKEG